MAKFCGKCGSRLDEVTGLCPNCDAEKLSRQATEHPKEAEQREEKAMPEKPLSKKDSKKQKKADKKAAKKAKKKEKRAGWSMGKKVRRFFGKLLLILFLLLILITAAQHLLRLQLGYAYFSGGLDVKLLIWEVIDMPKFISKLPALMNGAVSDDGNNAVPDSYKVTPPDAESYFASNSKVVTEIDAKESNDVFTEAEIYDDLLDRGFDDYPITTEYSMDGDYSGAAEISKTSTSKHPLYQSIYVSQSGDAWIILSINGVVMANPVSYNIQSNLGVQVIISEEETVTSYDSTANKFYETIPDKSALIVKVVERIDAETLDALTFGEIDGL